MDHLPEVTPLNNKAHNRQVISQVSCTAQDQHKLSIILSYFKLKLSLVGFNKLIDKPCSL